jgi:hypothetical protein
MNVLDRYHFAAQLELSYQAQPLSSAASLTIWSSRRPQASLVGALRATHSGAAYRER